MNTDKKNQHYIPKFYLRNFSYQNRQKQIGIFNVENSFYFPTSALKNQGSKSFFYGHDGIIEDILSDIEGNLATTLKNIITNKVLPSKGSIEHQNLLLFIVLTHSRNPVAIDGIIQSSNGLKRQLSQMSPTQDFETMPEISHDEAVSLSLSNVPKLIGIIADLKFKLLINKTEFAFISSDHPIIKYNTFLETKKYHLPKCGYASKGLQIFIPLNPEIMIVFYDSEVYKVGDKKKQFCEVSMNTDVEQLNMLHFLNCFDTIYFNEMVNEPYLKRLFKNSLKYNRANMVTSNSSYLYTEDEQMLSQKDEKKQRNLIILGSTDCEINLKISVIKCYDSSKHIKFDPTKAQVRNKADLGQYGR